MPRGKTQASLNLIDTCYQILAEIQPASVRAVAYQLFVRSFLESMAKTSTNRVSDQLVYAREEGIIPWDWIVDEAREEERTLVWDDIDECVRHTQATYLGCPRIVYTDLDTSFCKSLRKGACRSSPHRGMHRFLLYWTLSIAAVGEGGIDARGPGWHTAITSLRHSLSCVSRGFGSL
jgi:hypothetical protein